MGDKPIWVKVRTMNGLDYFIAEFLGWKETPMGPEAHIRYKDAIGELSETWLRMSQITVIQPEQGDGGGAK